MKTNMMQIDAKFTYFTLDCAFKHENHQVDYEIVLYDKSHKL